MNKLELKTSLGPSLWHSLKVAPENPQASQMDSQPQKSVEIEGIDLDIELEDTTNDHPASNTQLFS